MEISFNKRRSQAEGKGQGREGGAAEAHADQKKYEASCVRVSRALITGRCGGGGGSSLLRSEEMFDGQPRTLGSSMLGGSKKRGWIEKSEGEEKRQSSYSSTKKERQPLGSGVNRNNWQEVMVQKT